MFNIGLSMKICVQVLVLERLFQFAYEYISGMLVAHLDWNIYILLLFVLKRLVLRKLISYQGLL